MKNAKVNAQLMPFYSRCTVTKINEGNKGMVELFAKEERIPRILEMASYAISNAIQSILLFGLLRAGRMDLL